MPSAWWRAALASACALGFFLPLFVLLNTVIPATIQSPMYTESPQDQAVPVDVPGSMYQRLSGTYEVHRLRLVTRDIGRLASHSQIRLLVATYRPNPAFEDGDLAFIGTRCVYHTVRAAIFPNNDLLTFERGDGCAQLRGTPTGELRLTLRFTMPSRVALRTFVPPTGAAIGETAVVVADPEAPESPARPIVRGTLGDQFTSNSARRIALLAHVWQIAPAARWIWWALAVSTALLWVAIFLLAERGIEGASARAIARRMAGGFCGALALALAYAVLVPPFQSADEPNHFIGFAEFIHRAGMYDEGARWTRIGHFERIRFKSAEHFTPTDRTVLGIPWDVGGAPDAALRGAAVGWFWRAVPSWIRVLPAPRLLLALRVINALIFSIAVALFFGIVAGIGRARWPDLLAIPIFLVPTLPFFAMTVSNYALLVSVYVVLAAGIIVDLRDRDGAAAAGPIIGAAWTAAALLSRSALPLAPFVAVWVLGRLVVGHRDGRVKSAAVYWIGLAAFAAAGLWLADREYIQTVVGLAQHRLPWALAAVISVVLTQPWLIVVAGVCAAATEHWLSPRLRAASAPALRSAIVHTARIGALVVLVMLAASAVIQYPTLRLNVPPGPPPGEYVKSVLAAGSTIFRLTHPDFLTSVSFWGGFGWLETLPPPAFVSMLAAASGLAFAGLFYLLARSGAVRPLVRIGFAILGYIGSMATYALSVILLTPADLHGRYLLGLYLCMLGIGWTVVAQAVEAGWVKRTGGVRAALAASFVAVHVFSLGVILSRYF